MSDKNLSEELTAIEDLNVAYVVDEQGNEVAITQEMIDQAAAKLDASSSDNKT